MKNGENSPYLLFRCRSFLFGTILVLGAVLLASCSFTGVRLTGEAHPLKEYTLQGDGKDKILLIPVNGMLTDSPDRSLLKSTPSVVQQVVSQLQKAEKDHRVKAVLLKINSAGGTITASDILYHEILEHKKKTGAKVIASFMDVAASGAYYMSLPADRIIAHPTTVTGSVGVIFVRPKVTGLMNKVGVTVDVTKFGKVKDMGSPFRQSTPEEEEIMQKAVNDFGGRFVSLMVNHRNLNPSAVAEISTARVFIAQDALKVGLIDEIGYLDDAVKAAKKIAGLPENARLVIYRRTEQPNNNFYDVSAEVAEKNNLPIVNIDLADGLLIRPGFYYLWPGAAVWEQ